LFHIHEKCMFLKNAHPFSCFGYSVFTWIECEKFLYIIVWKTGGCLIDTHKAKHIPRRYFTENWRFWMKGNHIQVCMVCQQYAVHMFCRLLKRYGCVRMEQWPSGQVTFRHIRNIWRRRSSRIKHPARSNLSNLLGSPLSTLKLECKIIAIFKKLTRET